MTSFIQPPCPNRAANRLYPDGACSHCDRARLLLEPVTPEQAQWFINFYAVFFIDAEGVIWFTTPREHKWNCNYYALPPSRRYWVSEAALAVGMPVQKVTQMEMTLC